MVTRETESAIRDVIRPHIDVACQDLADAEVVQCWWPDGFAERLAEQMAQSIALMAESCEMAENETAGRQSG